MKNSITFILFLSILIVSCSTQSVNDTQIELAKEQVLKELFSQQDSWNDGDIDGFMKGYWNNDSLMFVSGERVSYGWQVVTDNYKKKYHSKELMGELTFNVDKLEVLAADAIIIVGEWNLKSQSADFGGKFTLLWRKINDEWKIVIDHTS